MNAMNSSVRFADRRMPFVSLPFVACLRTLSDSARRFSTFGLCAALAGSTEMRPFLRMWMRLFEMAAALLLSYPFARSLS